MLRVQSLARATVVAISGFLVLAGSKVDAEEIPVQATVLGLIDDIEVSTTEAGVIVGSEIALGDRVEEGQLLAQLDDQEARLQLSTAMAELEIARAEADDVLDIEIAEKALAVAAAELKRAEEAKATYDDSVSNTELDALRYTRDQAALKIERAKRSVDLARQRVRLQETVVDRARHQLERRRIHAPLSGHVVQVERHQGEWVQPGQILYRIIRIDRLRAEGYVDATITGLQTGMGVIVNLPAHSGESLETEGRVTFVDPEISSINGQYRILAEIENHDGRFRPGQKVGMAIILPDSDPE